MSDDFRAGLLAQDEVSIVKACQEFFSAEPYGRKVTIPEFKGLTQEDKEDLREMLIAEGYNVKPLIEVA